MKFVQETLEDLDHLEPPFIEAMYDHRARLRDFQDEEMVK